MVEERQRDERGEKGKAIDVSRVAEERPTPSGQRRLTGGAGLFISIVATTMGLYHIFFISALFMRLNINILCLQHLGISMGFMLFLIFLLHPASRGNIESRVKWYDILMSILSLVSCWYFAFFFETRIIPAYVAYSPSVFQTVQFIILLVLLLEAGRRTIGIALPILTVLFLIYMVAADRFPGILFGMAFDLRFMVVHMYLSEDAIWGVPMRVAATTIIAFLFFGGFILISGAGKAFLNFAFAVAGRVRGGPAKAAIVASSLFGTISGSSVANVVTTGSITIPMMKRTGYRADFAGAVEAVSSTGGLLMPPVMGIVAFIMAEVTGVPYITLCLHALVPAILYYIALFVQVDLEAARTGLRGLPREMLPSVRETIKQGWPFILPLLTLLYFLVFEGLTPEVSAIYSIVIIIIVSWFKKEWRLNLRGIFYALEYGSRASLIIGPACGLVGVILGSLNSTGVAPKISGLLVTISGGNFVILAAISGIAAFIMGMGITSIPIYIGLAVLVAPVLIQAGVPIIAAHLFIFYWAMLSFITPPVAITAFAAAGVADASPMKTGWNAARLGITLYIVPFMFLFNPSLLLLGELNDVIIALITAIIGVVFLAIGATGYLIKPINWPRRIVLFLAALCMIKPGWKSDLIGAGLCILALLPDMRIWIQTRNRNFKFSNEGYKEAIDD